MSAGGHTHLPTSFCYRLFYICFQKKETYMPSVCKKNCNLPHENKNQEEKQVLFLRTDWQQLNYEKPHTIHPSVPFRPTEPLDCAVCQRGNTGIAQCAAGCHEHPADDRFRQIAQHPINPTILKDGRDKHTWRICLWQNHFLVAEDIDVLMLHVSCYRTTTEIKDCSSLMMSRRGRSNLLDVI